MSHSSSTEMEKSQESTEAPLNSSNSTGLEKQMIRKLTRRAVFHSTAILHFDQYNDPLNYGLGIWGKLIILAAIRKQARVRKYNVERDIHAIDWDSIRDKIKGKFLAKKQSLLSPSALLRWLETRLQIFERQFPSYRNYIGEYALSSIMEFYAQTWLKVKNRLQFSQYLEWDNVHEWPPTVPFNKVDLENLKQILCPCFCTLDDVTYSLYLKDNQEVIPAGVVTRVNISQCSDVNHNSVSTSASVSEAASSSPVSSQKLDGAQTKTPEHSARCVEQGTRRAHIIVRIDPAGGDHPFTAQNVVIDHTGSKRKRSEFPTPCTSSAVVSAEQGETSQEGVSPNKKIKTDIDESTRNFLLTLVWQFKNGGGVLGDVSNFMAKMYAKHRTTCEFTLDNIERRILRGEIRDLHTLFCNCRCLMGMYIIGRNQSEIPPQVIDYMKLLTEACSKTEKKTT